MEEKRGDRISDVEIVTGIPIHCQVNGTQSVKLCSYSEAKEYSVFGNYLSSIL